MAIIHLVGPNAVGKTTAVVRWRKRYSKLSIVSLDLLRKVGYDTKAEKQERCKEWKELDQVVVVESARTTQLVTVSCDTGGDGVVLQGETRINIQGWKGSLEEKRLAVEKVRQYPLVVCESARTTTVNYALSDEPVIIVICSWQVLGKHLRARCEAKGKKFRDDYWDQKKLDYEASKRYLNFATKNLPTSQYKIFTIEDQARDWPAVDEYFGKLYRELHNDLVRKR